LTTSAENTIHPTALLEGDVVLGSGNTILPYTVITGPVEIGDDNIIGPHVAIGTPCADKKNIHADHSSLRVRIGSRNVIREFTAVQKPIAREFTEIHDDTYLMQGLHIAHDMVIESNVAVTANVAFGGRCHVMEGANIGLGVSAHQGTVIGAYAMIAMNAPIAKNVRPFTKYIPGRAPTANLHGAKRAGFGDCLDEIEAYVVSGAEPESPKVAAIVNAYCELHIASGRTEY
jgi:UDP-N-acetylglucosamine acyltransferase